MKTAYFVKYPRTYADVLNRSFTDGEFPYQIAKVISLKTLDFQNFIYGMDADREYLEKSASLCSEGAVKHCLLIKDGQKDGGILVVPDSENPSYVRWAAQELPE